MAGQRAGSSCSGERAAKMAVALSPAEDEPYIEILRTPKIKVGVGHFVHFLNAGFRGEGTLPRGQPPQAASAASAERMTAHDTGRPLVIERRALHFHRNPLMARLAVHGIAVASRRTAAPLLAGAIALLTACGAPSPSQSEARQQANERLARAEAMFKERCQKAGEKIHRTVDNVEGVFLLKIRPKDYAFGSQFLLNDPYGYDLGGDGYIESFLRGSFQATHRGTPAPGSPTRIGYLYVEAIDPADGKRYRYTGSMREVEIVSSVAMGGDGRTKYRVTNFVIDKVPAPGQPPRYGVTYDDLSTREEREYWIAGSSLRVIDLQTNEVIAERIGYMMDRGQGSRAGDRQPWLLAAANACPTFQRNPNLPLDVHSASAAQLYQSLDFVEKVLKGTKEK